MIIVVARYNENIRWTKQFQNVLIYNKGEKLEDGYNEILLENVGREGHTYYKYISDNYDNLEDYIIFLQGEPFYHSPNLMKNLLNFVSLYCYNNKELNIDFEFLSEHVIYSSLELEILYNTQCKNIYKTIEKIFGVNYHMNECIFGAGAQFIVSRNQILKKPKEFYENIVKILDYTIDPDEGYDIERLHKYIFS